MPLKSSLLCVKPKKASTKPSQNFQSQDSFTAACLIPSQSLTGFGANIKTGFVKAMEWYIYQADLSVVKWSFKSGRERLVISYQNLELNSDLLPNPETKATLTLCIYKVETWFILQSWTLSCWFALPLFDLTGKWPVLNVHSFHA